MKGQTVVFKLILVLIFSFIIGGIIFLFVSQSKLLIDDSICSASLSALNVIELKTQGFAKEVEAFTNNIFDIKEKIKVSCNTRKSKLDNDILNNKEKLYPILEQKFERCSKLYYNEENPFYETAKRGSILVKQPTHNTMFCIVCEDIEIEDDFLFNQIDYYNYLKNKKSGTNKYEYIGKYIEVEDDFSKESKDYFENYVSFIKSVLDGIPYSSEYADTVPINIVNSFTKNHINFFNPFWIQSNFRIAGARENKMISLVLLHYDFDGPRSKNKPLMAVLPFEKTHYVKHKDNGDYFYAKISYFLTKFENSVDTSTDLILFKDLFSYFGGINLDQYYRDFKTEVSYIASLKEERITESPINQFCTRFNYVE